MKKSSLEKSRRVKILQRLKSEQILEKSEQKKNPVILKQMQVLRKKKLQFSKKLIVLYPQIQTLPKRLIWAEKRLQKWLLKCKNKLVLRQLPMNRLVQ